MKEQTRQYATKQLYLNTLEAEMYWMPEDQAALLNKNGDLAAFDQNIDAAEIRHLVPCSHCGKGIKNNAKTWFLKQVSEAGNNEVFVADYITEAFCDGHWGDGHWWWIVLDDDCAQAIPEFFRGLKKTPNKIAKW